MEKTYTWGLDLSLSPQGEGGVGGLLKEGDLYPTYDANGNIMQKLDDTGSVVMWVTYDPFGNIIDGTLVGEYAFSTKPLIDNLQYYYYGFRYYDPETGRWLNRDPIGERGGLNVYGFVRNNPISFIDILGLCDRTNDISSLYENVNNDDDPCNDMTVAENTANILADMYADASNFDEFAEDVRDTFTDGNSWPLGNGNTTFGYLSQDGVSSGINESMQPNAEDFHRHLGGNVGASPTRSFIYFSIIISPNNYFSET